jgi:hypothetical protein
VALVLILVPQSIEIPDILNSGIQHFLEYQTCNVSLIGFELMQTGVSMRCGNGLCRTTSAAMRGRHKRFEQLPTLYTVLTGNLIDPFFLDDFFDIEEGLNEVLGHWLLVQRLLELKLCVEGLRTGLHLAVWGLPGFLSGLGGGDRVDECVLGLTPPRQEVLVDLFDEDAVGGVLALVCHALELLTNYINLSQW